jgi:tetraacyldisaccharide 4'-kinase
VVIDGARGLGNQRILPAGPLRESAGRLTNVDLVVTNGARRLEGLGVDAPLTMSLVPAQVLPVRAATFLQSLGDLRGRHVHAVAGIGNPARFFGMLRAHGMQVIEHAFPDHHPFAPNELIFSDGLPILMTEKDAVRAAGFANDHMYFVPVDADFSEADAQRLLAGVDHALNASQRATR